MLDISKPLVIKLKKLYDAGLTTILISVYDGGDAEDKFYKMCEELNLPKEAYVIRNRYKEAQEDFGLTLSNRAGNLENATYKVYSLNEPLKKPCTYPSYMFFVDYNGDVLMCSHDWGKKLILGNLNKNSFSEIWKGKKSMFARKKLNNSDRLFSPCDKCDVMGDVVGAKHARAWKN